MHKAKQYLRTTVDQLRQGLVAPAVAGLKLVITWSVTIDDDIASGIIRVAEDGEETGDAGVADSSDLTPWPPMATVGSNAGHWAVSPSVSCRPPGSRSWSCHHQICWTKGASRKSRQAWLCLNDDVSS